jgi:hypothetical protein
MKAAFGRGIGLFADSGFPEGVGACSAQGAVRRRLSAALVAAGCFLSGGRWVAALEAVPVAVGQVELSAAACAGGFGGFANGGGVHWPSRLYPLIVFILGTAMMPSMTSGSRHVIISVMVSMPPVGAGRMLALAARSGSMVLRAQNLLGVVGGCPGRRGKETRGRVGFGALARSLFFAARWPTALGTWKCPGAFCRFDRLRCLLNQSQGETRIGVG